jgi:toxin-antitoxin system PIN domain toxin
MSGMRSIDTNILFHSLNLRSPLHSAAYAWLSSIEDNEDVAISEFILAELYRLLRNPVILPHPLSAADAVDIIEAYRHHRRWRLIGFPVEGRQIHDRLWRQARASNFAYRRLYDARAALTMTSQGVTEFATVNVKDFEGLGFRRVWNPLAGE